MNPQRLLPRAIRLGTCIVAALGVAGASSAFAATITGTVTDSNTGQALPNIDLDLFDVDFAPVAAFADGDGTAPHDNTSADGTFTLDVAAGEYYVRADPSTAQGYVGQYAPGVFLRSEAKAIIVREGRPSSVTFFLDRGTQISGHITDAVSGAPAANIDLDLFAWDHSFVSTITALSDDSGSYTLSNLPAGNFYIKVDPRGVGLYLPQFYPGAATLDEAQMVTLLPTGKTGVDFHLVQGGGICGTVTDQDTGAPLASIDLDVFDAQKNFIPSVDAATDATGAFCLAALPAGRYFVQADPNAGQGYIDTWFGGSFDVSGATPVDVVTGASAIASIPLPHGGTISGVVTSSVTGGPLANVGVTLFDRIGKTKVVSTSTNPDGTYLLGAVPAGGYIVRCNGVDALGLAFEYYTNAAVASTSQPIGITAGSTTSGIDFALDRGGWIHGKITDEGNALADVDMDLFTPAGELLPTMDARTAADGTFQLGPIPAGTYMLRADPKGDALPLMWFGGAANLGTSTPLQVTTGNTLSNTDFLYGAPTEPRHDRHPMPQEVSEVSVSPNPFNPATTVSFDLTRATRVRLTILDSRGRVVKVLTDRVMPAGQHALSWDGRTTSGRLSPSGVHFLRFEKGDKVIQQKLILLK